MLSTMQDVPLSLTNLLRHGTSVHSDAEVVTWTADGVGRRRTFGEAGERAAQLAHCLSHIGISRGDRVGTLMWNNAEHFEAYAAVPSMGGVLHTLNLRLPSDQLAWIINDAADKVVIVDASLAPLLERIASDLDCVQHVIVAGELATQAIERLASANWAARKPQFHDYEEAIAGQPTSYPWIDDLDEREAAALCYTSGTTGHPKGVAYSHRSIYLHCLNLAMPEAFGMTWADNVLAVVPMFHVNAWGIPHAALMTGASMLMPDQYLQPGPLADMIETEKPTLAAGVPTIWSGLLSELDSNPRDVSSLRDVIVGGSACPPALMEAFESRHGLRLVQAWGMTETSPLGAVAREPHRADADVKWARRISQGRLSGSVQARLRGPAGELLPRDGTAAGELEVRGPWVTASYYAGRLTAQSEEEHDEKFTSDHWLKTGDIAAITPDGYITLTDRSKDVIKSGGEWISSIELESAIASHPSVAEAAVIAVPDERWGERPMAVVVLKEGCKLDIADLQKHLGSQIAKWQVPERWALIEEIPRTSVGKYNKLVLRQQHAEGQIEVLR